MRSTWSRRNSSPRRKCHSHAYHHHSAAAEEAGCEENQEKAEEVEVTQDELDRICDDTFAILGDNFDSPAARSLLWAIGRQEGRMIYRRQIGGPARGLWQFEQGGGVTGVLRHRSSAVHARSLCAERDTAPTAAAVWRRLEHDDILACGFARLLLFTDPHHLPIPMRVNEKKAWDYYIRNWRPGKPHRKTWGPFWEEACDGA